MFADPQTITVSTVAKTLNRTGTGPDTGAFASASRDRRLTINHNYGRRVRRTMRFQTDSLVANPLVSGQNINQSITIGFYVDLPAGYDATALKAEADGVVAYLAASSGAALTKLIGGES